MSARGDVLARFEPMEVDDDQAVEVERVRQAMRVCAAELYDLLPDGRSKSLALTKLEEAAMHATKAITHFTT